MSILAVIGIAFLACLAGAFAVAIFANGRIKRAERYASVLEEELYAVWVEKYNQSAKGECNAIHN